MYYRVLRKFPASGKTLMPGDVVDCSDPKAWRPRNVENLVTTRYLKPYIGPLPDLELAEEEE